MQKKGEHHQNLCDVRGSNSGQSVGGARRVEVGVGKEPAYSVRVRG
jgi:hypothetical protein